MEIDKTPAFDTSANDVSLTKSKKKKKKDKNVDIGEKQAEGSFQIEPSEKPAQVNTYSKFRTCISMALRFCMQNSIKHILALFDINAFLYTLHNNTQ